MLINYLTDMVDGSDIKRGIGLFAICLDLGAQYIFITALTEWSRGRWKKGIYKYRIAAIILLLIFGLYETCFAVPSSISFFLVQVDKKEKTNQAIIDQAGDNRDKLKDIKDELAALNIGLAAEAKTGVRQYSQNVIDRKKELQKQRDEIENSNSKTSTIIDKIAVSAINSFDVTTDNFGIPKKRAKVLTFGIAIFLLRVLMILFCIKIKGERAAIKAAADETDTETETEISVTDKINMSQIVTDNVTDIKSHVTGGKKPCPICGKPVKVKATYCGAKCRQTAHRQKTV
jgi:hypothetical protein